MTAAARAAADVASLLPMGDPLARVARLRLDVHVRATRGRMVMTRDASVDPRTGDFIPMRPVDGHPDVLKHAEVGEPEYYAAVAERRRQEAEGIDADG